MAGRKRGLGFEEGEGLLNQIQTNVAAFMPENGTAMYVRYSFEVDDSSLLTELILRLMYNDGFVAYLNGQELVAPGMLATQGGMDKPYRDDFSLSSRERRYCRRRPPALTGGYQCPRYRRDERSARQRESLINVELTASERRAGTPTLPPSVQHLILVLKMSLHQMESPGWALSQSATTAT